MSELGVIVTKLAKRTAVGQAVYEVFDREFTWYYAGPDVELTEYQKAYLIYLFRQAKKERQNEG